MVKIKPALIAGQWEKKFLELFGQLVYSRSAWQVWEDLITAMACSISNAADRTPDKFERREEQYRQAVERLGGVEIPSQIFGIIIMALEENPEQDFLGKIYMCLELGNHWKGQFFTPYSVCKMMSGVTCGEAGSQIEEKGYISICDPSCGAGATLIAAVNSIKRTKYNFQNHVLFVGQDIDRITGMMCYIQLSLLGCAGYICIGDTLTNPLAGHVLFPQEKEGQELWYMPMFYSDVWEMRRMFLAYGNKRDRVEKEKTMEGKKPDILFARRNQGEKKKMPERKKNSKNVDGQLDMFSMLGI